MESVICEKAVLHALSKYKSLATRRYRQYRRQECKKAIKKAAMGLLVRLLKMIGKIMQRRRIVEKVFVE